MLFDKYIQNLIKGFFVKKFFKPTQPEANQSGILLVILCIYHCNLKLIKGVSSK